jgi:carboxymethylenebutenolidase
VATSESIYCEEISIGAQAGRSFDAYLARPRAGTGIGLIVLHDMFGPSRVFHELAERYAEAGHCVLAPNLFWRLEGSAIIPYDEHARAAKREHEFDFDQATADLRLAADWLRASPGCSGKIAVWGFCFSGQIAYLAAARNGIDAAFSFYALGISKHLDEMSRIACPLQIHYGGADPRVPESETTPVTRAAGSYENITVDFYPGAGHSFFNPVRPMFDAEASRQAAARVDKLLAEIA